MLNNVVASKRMQLFGPNFFLSGDRFKDGLKYVGLRRLVFSCVFWGEGVVLKEVQAHEASVRQQAWDV